MFHGLSEDQAPQLGLPSAFPLQFGFFLVWAKLHIRHDVLAQTTSFLYIVSLANSYLIPIPGLGLFVSCCVSVGPICRGFGGVKVPTNLDLGIPPSVPARICRPGHGMPEGLGIHIGIQKDGGMGRKQKMGAATQSRDNAAETCGGRFQAVVPPHSPILLRLTET